MARPKKIADVQYIVIETFSANINNKQLKGARGDIVTLTLTEYNVLKRFVLPL